MKNQQYEQALDTQRLTFTYVEKLELAKIDMARSLKNQARLDTPVDKDLIAAYEAAFKARSKFPPLVVYAVGDRPDRLKYVLMDGVQRTHAALAAGCKFLDAYLVQTSDQKVIDRVTWSFNNHVNGKRLSAEECLEHAIAYVQKYGVAQEEAAKEWGVPAWKIRHRVKHLEVNAALDRQGVPHEKVPTEQAFELSPLLKVGEDVLAETARAVIDAGLSKHRTAALADSVQKAPTAEARQKVIADFRASPAFAAARAETKGGENTPRRQTPRERFQKMLKALADLLASYPGEAALRPGVPNDYAECHPVAHEVAARLLALFADPPAQEGVA